MLGVTPAVAAAVMEAAAVVAVDVTRASVKTLLSVTAVAIVVIVVA